MTFNMKMSTGRRHRRDLTAGVLIAVVLGAGAFVFWYRATYNVLPGQAASTRVHWCGRDYESTGGTVNWGQASIQEHTGVEGPIVLVGHYPPLGHQAALYAIPVRPLNDGAPCATDIYLKAGPDRYRSYVLEGGP